MKRSMQKYFSAAMAAALLLTMTACSDRQPPVGEIKSSSESIRASVPEAPETVSENAPEQEKGGFPIPTMTEEQSKYNTQYVEPLRFSALLLRSWSPDDISQLEPNPEQSQTGAFMMFAFEDIIGAEAMQAIWKDYPDGQIPETVVDEVLLAHFSFALDQLHQMNVFYKPEQKLYDYTGGRGGGPMETVVTDVTEREDGAILLEYTVLSDFPDETRALYRVPGIMTLVPNGESGYRYWSVEAKESEQTRENPIGTEFEIDAIKFKLALPEGWIAKGNEIYADDVKIAELLPFVPNGDGKAFEVLDEQYANAEVVRACTAGNYTGKYYHMQSEVSEGGITALENELQYYIDIGDQLLHFAFYPVRGAGIGTQREAFEAVLSTIGFHQ